MSLEEHFNERSPIRNLLDIEIVEFGEGYAKGHLAFSPKYSSTDRSLVAHGGVVFTLADSVGGAALMTHIQEPTPTLNMQIQYHYPGTDDLFAEAHAVDLDEKTGEVDIDVEDSGGNEVASATGTYMTRSLTDDLPWYGILN